MMANWADSARCLVRSNVFMQHMSQPFHMLP